MELNKFYEDTTKTRKFKIVRHQEKYISKRIFKFTTSNGASSVGDEIYYNDFKIAIAKELTWLHYDNIIYLTNKTEV